MKKGKVGKESIKGWITLVDLAEDYDAGEACVGVVWDAGVVDVDAFVWVGFHVN